MIPRTNHQWLVAGPLAVALVVLAGLAPAVVHRSDNFNNNSIAAFWGNGASSNSNVVETNGRLEFNNTGPTGDFSSAGAVFLPFGINWKHDFHVEFDYRLKVNNAAGTRQVLLDASFSVAGVTATTFTGLAAGVMRDSSGMKVGIFEYENGDIVASHTAPITQFSGTIEIDWDKSMDRMTVQRSGGPSVHLDGYFAANGGTYGNTPMETGIGVITYGGNVNYTGANCFIDNWQADFVKRAFP